MNQIENQKLTLDNYVAKKIKVLENLRAELAKIDFKDKVVLAYNRSDFYNFEEESNFDISLRKIELGEGSSEITENPMIMFEDNIKENQNTINAKKEGETQPK